jgi:RNA polymerase sigma-70 factor (ECF subfamily)
LGEASEESPHDHAERSELAHWIDKGLQTLPYDQRITLVLSDIDGFAYEEIAVATNTNVGTVKSRLSRARAHLREFLLEQQELLPDSFRLKHRTEGTKNLRVENV